MQIREGFVRLGNMLPGPIARQLTSASIGAKFLRPFINRCIPQKPIPIIVRSGPARGLRLVIDPRWEKFYWTGAHETHVQEAMVRLLKPGMTVWDVGAHAGFFTLLASRLVGPSGHVHAFEPAPDTRRRLHRSVHLNNARNVTVHDCAVSDLVGDVMLFVQVRSAVSSIVRFGVDCERFTVRCTTLDRFAGDNGRSDLIKIDVEGAEVDVLRGGVSLLSKTQTTLLVEFSNDQFVNQARSLLPNYQFIPLGSHNWLLR